jgi:hypothetical protein
MSFPIANGKYRKPARILASLLCFSGLAIWLFHFYVWYQYDGTRPRHPDTASGRVYSQNTHGHVVYLTKEEDARITKLTILAFSLFGAGFLIAGLFVEKIAWRRSPAPWEKRQW